MIGAAVCAAGLLFPPGQGIGVPHHCLFFATLHQLAAPPYPSSTEPTTSTVWASATAATGAPTVRRLPDSSEIERSLNMSVSRRIDTNPAQPPRVNAVKTHVAAAPEPS